MEFDLAGNRATDRLSGAVTALEIDQLYIKWALRDVQGLEIDGKVPDPDTLIESGPEELCREIADEIKRECGLTEAERKN